MSYSNSSFTPEDQPDGLLTRDEAAAFLRISPRTLDAWVALRKVPVFKLSRKMYRYRRRDLERVLERHRVEAIH